MSLFIMYLPYVGVALEVIAPMNIGLRYKHQNNLWGSAAGTRSQLSSPILRGKKSWGLRLLSSPCQLLLTFVSL